MSFSRRVVECEGNKLKIHSLCSEQALALANLINAQTTAALLSFLLILKKEIPTIIGTSLEDSGKNIIEAFKNNHMSKEN